MISGIGCKEVYETTDVITFIARRFLGLAVVCLEDLCDLSTNACKLLGAAVKL